MIHLPSYPCVWQTAAGTFRSSLTWELTLSVPLTLVIVLGFVLLLLLQWHDLRHRVSRLIRWGLCRLRAVAYLLVLRMLLHPALLIQKVLPILPPLVMMVETSGSMALADPGKPSRLQQVQDSLYRGEHAAFAALGQHYQRKLYQCDDTARALSADRLADAQVGRRSTETATSRAHGTLTMHTMGCPLPGSASLQCFLPVHSWCNSRVCRVLIASPASVFPRYDNR
jgi:hypothetical protein